MCVSADRLVSVVGRQRVARTASLQHYAAGQRSVAAAERRRRGGHTRRTNRASRRRTGHARPTSGATAAAADRGRQHRSPSGHLWPRHWHAADSTWDDGNGRRLRASDVRRRRPNRQRRRIRRRPPEASGHRPHWMSGQGTRRSQTHSAR